MDWNDLRYFLAIQRTGTLSGAAKELGVLHSTVGRRLTALEEALGATLFTRTPDGFALTEAGAAILPAAEEAERAFATVAARAQGDDRRLEGIVRLATSESLSGFLVKKLAAVPAKHPGLLVEVLSGNQVLDLSRREADLAVRVAPTTQGDLVSRRLALAGWGLYAAQGYVGRRGAPGSARTLDGHEIIGFDDFLKSTPGALWFERHGKGARVVLRASSILSVLNAAIAGMGVAALPCFLGDVEETLVRIGAERIGLREVWLVVHPDVARTARVRVVMDFLIEAMTASAERFAGVGVLE
jgi:DNA-binding transcriptional LysR family regulator